MGTRKLGERERNAAGRRRASIFPILHNFPARAGGGSFGKCPRRARDVCIFSHNNVPGRGGRPPGRADHGGPGKNRPGPPTPRPGVPRRPLPPSLPGARRLPAAPTHGCTRGRRSACARRSGGPGRARRWRRRGGRAAGAGAAAAAGRGAAGGPAAGLRPCWRAPAAGREQTRQQRRREGDVAGEGPARPGPAATAGGGGRREEEGSARTLLPSQRHPIRRGGDPRPPAMPALSQAPSRRGGGSCHLFLLYFSSAGPLR